MLGNITVVTPDYNLQIAKGLVPSKKAVNKYGRTTNADASVTTDVHNRANATDTQAIWIAPTQARIHAIVSASDEDSETGGVNPQGDGLRTMRIYGLTSWDTAEITEDISLDGTNAVNTVNSFVIIHRMEALTWGSHASGTNVGKITATAATDATITAQIEAGSGQTQMAVYGIPSTQTAFIQFYYASILKAAAATNCLVRLVANTQPDFVLTNFVVKNTFGLDTNGTSCYSHEFKPPYKIAGPAIIKVDVNSNANNSDVSGGFDIIVEDN
jgi:hypothetical protein